MWASELAQRLRALVNDEGDFEVLVDVISENQVFPLTPTIEIDRFEPAERHYVILTTQPQELV